MEQSCGNCRFFLMQDKNVGAGVCRRFPPTVIGGEWTSRPSLAPGQQVIVNQIQNIAGQNPPTTRDLWCGEWDELPPRKQEAN
jgi:hypothetical protein